MQSLLAKFMIAFTNSDLFSTSTCPALVIDTEEYSFVSLRLADAEDWHLDILQGRDAVK